MDMSKKKLVYFAAANTPSGFAGYFDRIFAPDRLKKIYILKGGPGTGKSYLLSQLGEAAEASGHRVEYFLCSSDTSSLDAVLIPDLSLAVLDGTAPHMTDPVYPGAVEVIINLGDFFDIALLCENAADIKRLTSAKRELYKKAYSYMKCAAVLRAQYDVFASDAFLYEKCAAFARRLVASLPSGGGALEEVRLTHAIGTGGEVQLSTFENISDRRYVINDFVAGSYILLGELRRCLLETGHHVLVSYSPLDTSKVDGLCLPELSVSFTVNGSRGMCDGDTAVNMTRFVDRSTVAQNKKRLRFLQKAERAILDEALLCLSSVKALHDGVEAIYFNAMDFVRKEKFSSALISDILGCGGK